MNTKQLTAIVIGIFVLAFIVGILLIVPVQAPTPAVSENIRVSAPRPDDVIGFPLVIRGEARVFENNFLYRLLDEDGAVLVENFDTALAPDIGQFGPFEVRASYAIPSGTDGTLEVFSGSAKDGSEINKVIIPVRFGTAQTSEVKVFWGSRREDPNTLDCGNVYPVTRRIAKTTAVAHAALEELLKGPTINEGHDDFFSSINPGVKINSLTITNGVARVDFDEMLGLQVGGSCRVIAIRAQIEETLKQFPTVQSVIISIEGRVEDILQP